MPFKIPVAGKKIFLGGFLKKINIKSLSTSKMSLPNKIESLVVKYGNPALELLPQLMAEEFADDLKKIIRSQSIAWTPLSPAYTKKKKMLGLDPRILIATGRYINSIQAIQNKDGSWEVNVPPEQLSPGSKYTLQDLAHWLEYGVPRRGLPCRPHWRPAAQIWKTKTYQAKLYVKQSLLKKFKQYGFR
jgi:hypothetical protein